jgi:hypothetical protein
MLHTLVVLSQRMVGLLGSAYQRFSIALHRWLSVNICGRIFRQKSHEAVATCGRRLRHEGGAEAGGSYASFNW